MEKLKIGFPNVFAAIAECLKRRSEAREARRKFRAFIASALDEAERARIRAHYGLSADWPIDLPKR